MCFVVLEFEHRALHVASKQSTTELHFQLLFIYLFILTQAFTQLFKLTLNL